MILTTASAQQTFKLGAQIGALLESGDLVLLIGDLGAGKTALTQGIASGLGVGQRITSPTFVLTKQYRGTKLCLLHIDAYRLASFGEIDDLDIESALEEGVVVVEWGEAIAPAYLPTIVVAISGQAEHRDFNVELVGDLATGRATKWLAELKEFAA